ncbi:hypothetical protein [Actinoplanes sp. NPDC023714]|uniref:hypothetical protein n=1 Tax=Actinoplanes sp. NPDC023714 TaxID=3154322 RepID=UPI00340AB76C
MNCSPRELRAHFAGRILQDGLDEEEKLLILSILPSGSAEILLEVADKGLSGSKTFHARYRIPDGLSKRFVVKVGTLRKIEREASAVLQFAAPLLDGTNSPVWRRGETKAVIAQELVNLNRGAQLSSLRNRLRERPDSAESVSRLLRDGLAPWYEDPIANGPVPMTLDALFSRHVRRGGAVVHPEDWVLLKEWTENLSGVAWREPSEVIGDLLRRTVRVPKSISHGDLHSQNILVDPAGRCWPIDFAWCTNNSSLVVDLVMLECSLKFLAFPMRADLQEMIRLERALTNEYIYSGSLPLMPYATELRNVLGGLVEVRRFARDAGISFADYRACLAVMTSSLATHAKLNRPLVLASLQILMGSV